jgi:hypothetical protein
MNKNLLITFGCSWTFGVGVGYQYGQNEKEYLDIAWDKSTCDTKSFRGILSKNFGLDNKNFAHGGSSNQAQFKYAKKYFGSSDFLQDQKTYEKIVVLHAITSTARNVFFDVQSKSEAHLKYYYPHQITKFLVKYLYDHAYEVEQLTDEINFWNFFYKSVGIKNIWVDTFNHHHYRLPIDNMIMANESDRDLLSQLCVKNNFKDFDRNYHYSAWRMDSNRVAFLVGNGLLNPISNHPTEQGHIQIAEFIAPVLESKL